MFGMYIGELAVYYKKSGGETLLFNKIGGQGPGWKTATMNLPSDSDIQASYTLMLHSLQNSTFG